MGVRITIVLEDRGQDVATNTSKVYIKINAAWDSGSYNLKSPAGWIKFNAGTSSNPSALKTVNFAKGFNSSRTTSGVGTLYENTFTVYHDSNGNKSLSVEASYDSGVSSGTVQASVKDWALKNIPRKSTLSVSSGVLGQTIPLTVNRKSTSFTHTITWKCGSDSGTVCTKSSATSINWTPELGNTVALSKANTTGTYVQVTFTITTYNGSTSIGSNSVTIGCDIPASVKPSCSIAIEELTNHIATYGKPIQGISEFRVVVNPTRAYSSPIKTYSLIADGSTYSEQAPTTGVLKDASRMYAEATVTDARGRTSDKATASIDAFAYTRPIISKLTVHRCNSDGTANDRGECIKAVFSYSVTGLSRKNAVTVKLRHKKASENTYSNTSYMVPHTKYSASDEEVIIYNADTGSSYDVLLEVSDSFFTASKLTSASTAFTLMHWNANGTGMAVGKISEVDYLFDIGIQTRLAGGLLYTSLGPETDLNDLRTPGFYTGYDIKTNAYANCPLVDGSFTLVVYGAGGSGQARQYIVECDKLIPEKYERFLYPSSGWGEWIKLSPTSLAQVLTHVPTAANTFELVSSITIPANKYFTITARGIFNNASCKGVVIGENDNNYKYSYAAVMNDNYPVYFPSCTYSGFTQSEPLTLYIWGSWAGTNTNQVKITGFYIPY